jgi:hypoxanthine phosphoribosyltransferase
MMNNYQSYLKKILIPEDALQKRIAELGQEISKDYADKNLMLVCILRGGVMFLTDLMRQISIPHVIEFMAVTSYGAGNRESTGSVRITLDLFTQVYDRDVLLVEDIIDSGNTLSSVIEMLNTRKPRSLYVCTLLDKKERREIEVPIKYTGFSIPNEFVFGYGLDLDDYFRNLPFIAVVDLEKYQPPE